MDLLFDIEFDSFNSPFIEDDVSSLLDALFDNDGDDDNNSEDHNDDHEKGRQRRSTARLLDDIFFRDRQLSTSSQGNNILDIDFTFEWPDPPNDETNSENEDYKTGFDDFDNYFDMHSNDTAENNHDKSHLARKVPKKENVETSEAAPSDTGKYRAYRVEQTPPVQPNGVRLCIFCNGHVRPQMCGGNKHRWRCVNKQCRKWYGWVRSNEEIPRDLGKKGRWKDLSLKIQGFTEDGRLVPMVPPPDDVVPNEMHVSQTKSKKRRNRQGATNRPLSPVSEKQIAFTPTKLESRVHWWRSDRKRVEPSPERQLEVNNMTIPALCRIIEQSCRATAIITKSQTETGEDVIDDGTATGFIDMMMDTVFGSVSSLMSLTSTLPFMDSSKINSKMIKNLEYLPIVNS